MAELYILEAIGTSGKCASKTSSAHTKTHLLHGGQFKQFRSSVGGNGLGRLLTSDRVVLDKEQMSLRSDSTFAVIYSDFGAVSKRRCEATV